AAKVVNAAVELRDQPGQPIASVDRREQLEAQRPEAGLDSPADPRVNPASTGRPGRDPGRVDLNLPGVGDRVELELERTRAAAGVETDPGTVADAREIEIEALGHRVEPRVGVELELADLAGHVVAALQPLDLDHRRAELQSIEV